MPDSLDVENYDGSEGWFKIASAGAKNDTTWLLLWEKEVSVTVPFGFEGGVDRFSD